MFLASSFGKMLLLVWLLVCVPAGLSIRCYSCSSLKDPDVCGSDFKLTSQNHSHIASNCDTCHKYLNKDNKEITRNCTYSGTTSFKMSFGCKTETMSGHVIERCSCSKELCNDAFGTHQQNVSILLFLTIFALSFPFIH